MKNYTITYSIDVDDDDHSGTVDVMDRTMMTSMAKQYAANHLLDTTDVEPGSFDVHAIEVDWERA